MKMWNRLSLAFKLLFRTKKGGEDMMAKLFALNIVDGLNTFDQVPRRLKPAVRKQLEIMGVPELAGEEDKA